MSRRIGVWGACDTGGVSAALQILLKGDTVSALIQPDGDEEEKRLWVDSLPQHFDVLLISLSRQIPRRPAGQDDGAPQIVRFPVIHFNAFHPDLTYVGRLTDNTLIQPDYHSGICVWSFVNGLPADRTVELFKGDIFEALNYFDGWDASVAALQTEFVKCGLDFRLFLQKVKRNGAFMHSFNHPKAATLITLAKCIAIKLGEPEAVMEVPVYFVDGLAHLDWPVYPEIGEHYGVETLYRWTNGNDAQDLTEYVAAAFDRYKELNLKRDEIFYNQRDKLDAVLRPLVGL